MPEFLSDSVGNELSEHFHFVISFYHGTQFTSEVYVCEICLSVSLSVTL